MFAALLLTGVVGVVLGTLGSGGSIVMVPVLVYVAELAPGDAVAVSLFVVGGTSALGAYLRQRAGQLHWRAVTFLSFTGMLGAVLGSRLTHLVDPRVLMLLFAALMLAVGTTMMRGRRDTTAAASCRPGVCMSIGAGIGALTGFLGVGGGFLIVPALVFLAGLDTAAAVGASLAIIAFNSFGGVVGHLATVALLWRESAAFLAVAAIGMLAGSRLTIGLSERTLQKAFAYMVLAVGTAMAAVNLHALV